jgi:NAD(P)-dependent dehydrogenase (short-subunit alcohol dehydrogenase family)
MMNRVSERNPSKCLIIGGSKGIGKAIVRKFLSEKHEVISVARTGLTSPQLKALTLSERKNYAEIHLDMFEEESVSLLIELMQKKKFDPDVVVFALGGPDKSNTEKYSDYARVLRLNCLIQIEMTLSLVQTFNDEKHRKLIYIGSLVTKNGKASLPYIVSKSALLSFVKFLTQSLGTRFSNFEPLIISPGPIEVTGKGLKRLKEENPLGLAEWLLERKIHLGRLGTVDEVANLVFLLSSKEVGFMHGANIEMDGGSN